MSDVLKILDKDFPFIPTNKDTNYLICKEFKEVFLGVLEIECHGNKLIAESVGDGLIKLDVEFDGKLYETYFQLKKGDEDAVIFSLKNLGDGRRIYKEEVEVVKSIVKEEALPDPEPLIESYEVVEEAKIDIEKYKNDAIKVINENFSNKKQKIEQLQESLTNLIDERLSELSSITANEVSNLKEDIIKSVDESISNSRIDRDKTLVEINSIKDDVSSTAEFWSNILISNAKEKTEQLQSLKESVAFEIDTKIAELKSELKSQELHITEAYDSIQSFINKTKRELLEEKTSSYANLEQLQKQANLVVSENLKKADLLVGKKITQLQSTADKKINDLTSLVENRVSSFDGKVNEINSALERAGIALTESINEAVKNIEYKSQESAFKLDVEVQSKINELDKTKQELTTIAESQVIKLESKIKDVEDATNKAERSLTTTVNEAVNKMQLETSAQTAEIDKAKNQLTSVAEKSLSDIKQVAANLTETVEKKVRDVTLVAVKKEDLAQLKKQLEARLDNESASLKKYVAGYGGGGSVAQQFAAGGTINGTLNIASGQILSGGVDLASIFSGGGGSGYQTLTFTESSSLLTITPFGNTVSLSSLSGGGGGPGIDTGVRTLTGNWQNTYTDFSNQSANNSSVYSNVNANSALVVTQFNDQNTSAYQLVLADRGKTVTDNYSSNAAITIPSTGTVTWNVGDWIRIVQGEKSAGQYTTFTAGGGVSLKSLNNSLSVAGNWGVVTALYKGSNTWYLYGDLKEQTLITSYLYTVYAACDSSGNTTAYSDSNTVGNGIILYANSNLTTLCANKTFYYGSPIREYTTNGSGVVTQGAYCYQQYTTYTNCTTASPNTVYMYYGYAPNNSGQTLYSDSGLTTPIANTSYAYSSYRWTTNGSGIIAADSPSTCPAYIYNVYTDCAAGTVQATLRSAAPLGTGVFVYTDDTLTTPYASQTFYGGSPITQYTTDSSGYITSYVTCYLTWDTKATCNDERDGIGSTTNYYTYYANSVLQNGVTVYTDTALTTTLNNTTFVRNGYVYTTNGSGVLGTPTPCIYSLTQDTNCSGSNNGTIYTNKTGTNAATLYSQGATIYSDAGGSSPITNTNIHIVSDSNYLLTDGGGVVQAYYACST